MKNLLESIRTMYQPQSEATMMKDDGKMVHNCAKHVEHAEYGQGQCISEEHAAPDRHGNIAWYDIVFEHGVERGVPVTELNVLQSESHMHATKKPKKMTEAEDLSGTKKNGKMQDDEDEMEDEEMEDDDDDMEDEDKPKKMKKMAQEAYAGKNPHAIKSVASGKEAGMMHVTTNAGAVHKISAKDTGGKMPKPGEHINTYVKEGADLGENWIVHKDGKVLKSGIKQHSTAKAHAEKLGAKVNSAEWYHDNVTSKNKQGMAEDVGAVDEKMQVFHATSPGAQMKRYHKDSPAPEAAAHRNAAAAAAKGLRATGALKRKSFSYGSTDDIKTPKGGTVMAMKREAVEGLDELSNKTLDSYKSKAYQDYRKQVKDAGTGDVGHGRVIGIARAQQKRSANAYAQKQSMKNEEFEDDVDATMIHHNAMEIPDTIMEADKNYDAYFKAHMKKHGIKHPGEFKTDAEKKAFFNKVDAGFKAQNEEVFLEAWMGSAIQDVMAAHKKAGNKISDEKSTTKEGKPHHSFVVTTPEGKRTRHIYHGSNKKLETMSPAARSKEAKEVGDDEDDK